MVILTNETEWMVSTYDLTLIILQHYNRTEHTPNPECQNERQFTKIRIILMNYAYIFLHLVKVNLSLYLIN
jgi:hypothetical protein